jgi:hypothetical protein
LVASQIAPRAGSARTRPCWASKTKSFDYKDKHATPAGIEKLSLKEGVAGKASIQVKGEARLLGFRRSRPLTGPAPTCSSAAATAGICFGTTFQRPVREG